MGLIFFANLRVPRCWRAACLTTWCFVLLTSPALAQSTPSPYREYPQTAGAYQALHLREIPSWITLDMELRARTEAQTAINYTPGNAQAYELTRVRGGLAILPTSFLTGYISFHYTHALCLHLSFITSYTRCTSARPHA